MRTRRYLALAAIAALLAWSAPGLAADEIDDFFQEPGTDADTTAGQGEGSSTDQSGQAEQGGSVLKQLQAEQEKLSLSWALTTGGGAYFGWTALSALSDPVANFGHTTIGTIKLSNSLDLRPFDYLRIHETSYLSYPNGSYYSLSFDNITWLSEAFFDYSLPSGLAVRMGKYGVSWGNARILGVADLPGRTALSTATDDSLELEPAWLRGPTPSLWIKGVVPVGSFTATGLVSMPNAAGQGFADLAYGGLAEYVTGKTYLGLSGFYQAGTTARCALMLKTSAWGVDFYADSCLALPYEASPLFSIMGGLFYQASSGPDIKATAELRWNGESSVNGGLLAQGDSLPQGGLSQAMAFSWSSFLGTGLNLGLTWYHYWMDNSGAVVGYLSYPLINGLSIKGVLPFIYGSEGSYYVENPPSETYGYALGGAILLVLSVDF